MTLRPRISLSFLLLFAIACGDQLGAGVPCFDSLECSGSDICAATEVFDEEEIATQCIVLETDNFCMKQCDATTINCDDGEACVLSGESRPEGEERYVCLPGGGTLAGANCCASSECNLGQVCVGADVDTPGVCSFLCDPTQTGRCPIGLACQPFDDNENRGFCVVPPE